MKDEALRMALEALNDRSSLMKWQKAREAIEQALEQPEPEPVGYLYVTDPWGAPEYHFSVEKKEGYFNEPVYKHPPKREPEPEPVAWTDEMAKVPDHVWGKREPLTDEQLVQAELFKLAVRKGLLTIHTEYVSEPRDPVTKVSWMEGHDKACDISNEAAHGIKGEA